MSQSEDISFTLEDETPEQEVALSLVSDVVVMLPT